MLSSLISTLRGRTYRSHLAHGDTGVEWSELRILSLAPSEP